MNCRNCGAPLPELNDVQAVTCHYCSAMSLVDLDTPEGLQLVDAVGDFDCPGCRTPLTQARCCDVSIEACETCDGLLFPEGTFSIVVQGRRRGYRGPDMLPRPRDPKLPAVERACPGCGETMECHPYHGPGNAVIDFCAACSFVWLDSGELTAIERAPGSRK